ncbi:hypothetical protein Droror1_Dr00012187 [Drosera rotundifolia]
MVLCMKEWWAAIDENSLLKELKILSQTPRLLSSPHHSSASLLNPPQAFAIHHLISSSLATLSSSANRHTTAGSWPSRLRVSNSRLCVSSSRHAFHLNLLHLHTSRSRHCPAASVLRSGYKGGGVVVGEWVGCMVVIDQGDGEE